MGRRYKTRGSQNEVDLGIHENEKGLCVVILCSPRGESDRLAQKRRIEREVLEFEPFDTDVGRKLIGCVGFAQKQNDWDAAGRQRLEMTDPDLDGPVFGPVFSQVQKGCDKDERGGHFLVLVPWNGQMP